MEKGTGGDEEDVGPLVYKVCEGRVDLAAGTGIEDLDLYLHGASSRFGVSHVGLSKCKGWIAQYGNTSGRGYHLMQQFHPLCRQLTRKKVDPGQIAARPGETGDQTNFDRVIAHNKDNGDR